MGIFDDIDFDEQVSTFEDGIDFLINNGGLNCLLIYPDRQEDCPNCEFDSLSNRSANVYTAGGPVPFTNGDVCPYCDGVGLKYQPVTETIKMIVVWNPKEWISLPQANKIDVVKTPRTMIQTWAFSSDIPKILNAQRIRFETNLEGYIKWEGRRVGEPAPQGLKNSRYFVCMWEREGG